MHFTTLYLMKNEKLEDTSIYSIADDFGDRFCYCCGETHPRYRYLCDWFSIGGRWCDILEATNGLHGERSWTNGEELSDNIHFSVAEIGDLTAPIDPKYIYCVALKSKVIEDQNEIRKYIDLINSKKINGVIALIDCHD